MDRLGGYPVVVKQVNGMGGDGVARIDNHASANRYLGNNLEATRGLVVQTYLPPQGRTDLRLLVIGDDVAGAMKLTPAENDFRANVNQDGTAHAFDPPGEWRDLAVATARACRLDIAGIDMIVEKGGRPLVVEVNYSPGFKGLEAATDMNIAQKIIEYTIHFRSTHGWETK